MKKEMTLTERNASYNDLSRLFTDVATWFHAPMEWLRRYYSAVLEQEVSNKQAFYITQAQIAFILTAFSVMSSVLLHVGCLVWFIFCLYRIGNLPRPLSRKTCRDDDAQ
ncbi:hypothetical protein [Prevotella fusca]|uniref:Uncharacterized protein n=1 Tax=Prevotella fusca JCM 17724 TaxID=1236517 RepID=A0A0K1NKP6_9BACT|nr:hypothetical protein [Prevotella fusca]AKU69256.1 hypothetical protein ADJ77_05480 [Prevotella fusca JCM 17724]QUB86886.1 hypothetical protein J5A51_12560 [Prevotella fusca JCM 17724]